MKESELRVRGVLQENTPIKEKEKGKPSTQNSTTKITIIGTIIFCVIKNSLKYFN
jgi:hypothetical protein